MKGKIIVKRYAEAFLAYAKEDLGLEKVAEEFKDLKRVIHDNPQIQNFLNSPEILDKEKSEFVDNVFKEIFSQELRQFLRLLIEKKRIGLIIDIADYIRVNHTHGEAVDALLKSAYPLDLDVISAIKQKLEMRLQKKLNFFLELDGNLLGGVEVTIGNTVIDGTLRKRLDDLKEKLKDIRGV